MFGGMVPRSGLPRRGFDVIADRPQILLLAAIVLAVAASLLWLGRRGDLALLAYGDRATLNAAESISKILALLAGAAFAVYKIVSGANVANLELDLVCDRIKGETDRDHDDIIVNATVRKGERGTLILHGAWAHVVELKGEERVTTARKPVQLWGIDRLDLGALAEREWKRAPYRSTLYLAPGDTMSFAARQIVECDKAYIVEVLVAGSTALWPRKGQWRSAKVLLPTSGSHPSR